MDIDSAAFYLEIAKGLPTALVALLIGSVIYRWYLLARKQFQLDLFERRLAAFKALEEHLLKMSNAKSSDEVKPWDFYKNTTEIGYLFGKEVVEFLREISFKEVSLHASLRRYEEASGDKNIEDGFCEAERQWFEWRGKLEAIKLFDTYLRFQK